MCSSIFTNFLINPSSLSLYLSLSLYTDFTMVPCSVWAHSCIVNVWLYAWGKRWAGVPTGWKYDWILRPGYFLSLFLFHILSLTTFRKRKKWEKYPCLQTFFFFVPDDSKTNRSLYHRGESQTGPSYKTKALFRLTRKEPWGQWVLS